MRVMTDMHGAVACATLAPKKEKAHQRAGNGGAMRQGRRFAARNRTANQRLLEAAGKGRDTRSGGTSVTVDVGVLIGMFALRLGVPILLTVAVCYGLDRLAARRAAELAARRQAKDSTFKQGAKVVRQLHCWEIKRCEPEVRESCPATQRQNVPCWLALQLAGQPLSDECRFCAMYDLRKAA